MSKLLKLKDWLPLDAAAKHLSLMFDEEVSRPDVLRLALDGRLTLSVNIVNGAPARCGQLVPKEKAKWKDVPGLTGEAVSIPEGVPLSDGSMIMLRKKDIVSLRGVFDLPMIGNEQLDVEYEY